MHKQQVPMEQQRDVMYGRIVCDCREGKAEPNHTQLTVGVDKIHYLDDCGTPTAELTVKLLLNSVILTPNAWFMIMDIKNFYLNTPLKQYDYLCLNLMASWGCKTGIQAPWEGHTKWVSVCWSVKMDVWIATSRAISRRTFSHNVSKTWVWKK